MILICNNKFHQNFNSCLKSLRTIFNNPSTQAEHDTRSVFKWSLTGLNSEFSFSETSCLTKAEEPSLSYYLPIAGRRIIGFIHFPRVLVLCEMQSVSSRIWIRVAVSISYDDNHYTMGTSITPRAPPNLWEPVCHEQQLTIWALKINQQAKIRIKSYIYITKIYQGQVMTQSIFKQSTTGLNPDLPSPRPVTIPRLSYYLPIDGFRREGFISFLRAFGWSETQTTLPRIQTWLSKSISYNYNQYTTYASVMYLNSM